MNNTLTAKEWLEKEGLLNHELRQKEYYVIEAGLMERYANYRTKMLKEKFNKYWKETEMRILELEGRLKFIENIYEGSK